MNTAIIILSVVWLVAALFVVRSWFKWRAEWRVNLPRFYTHTEANRLLQDHPADYRVAPDDPHQCWVGMVRLERRRGV